MSRKFLKEVGNKYLEEYHPETPIITWEVEDLNGIKQAYVVEHNKGEKFLLGRGIYGTAKFQLIQFMAWELLYHTWPIIETYLPEVKDDSEKAPATQFIILKGAYPFDLQNAWQRYGKSYLPPSWINLTRKLNKKTGKWEIDETSISEEPTGKLWLIPDTAVASGSTISYLLKSRLQQARENPENELPETVMLYTHCGSLLGANKAAKICKEYNINFIPVFSQAIFEVSLQGNLPDLPYTDLPIENEGTITSEQFYKKAHKTYQGKPLCAIGDIGDSISKVEQYLFDTFREIAEVEIDPSEPEWKWCKKVWKEKKFKGEFFRTKLAENYPKAHSYFREKLAVVDL